MSIIQDERVDKLPDLASVNTSCERSQSRGVKIRAGLCAACVGCSVILGISKAAVRCVRVVLCCSILKCRQDGSRRI